MPAVRVLNPQVVVGFAGDLIWIHAGAEKSLSTTDARLLPVLAAFRRPADIEEVASRFRDPDSARATIAELERIGALHSPEDQGDATTEPAPEVLIEQYLQPLAVAIDGLAGTLAAIGPEQADSIHSETGVGLKARVMGATAAVMGIEQAIGARIPAWIEAQVERLQLPARGLSINVGSGARRLEGWVNIDGWPAELALDFRRGLPLAAGSADRVYLSHVLEHMSYPNDTIQLVREIHRVLAPGGRVRIVVPDIEQCIQAYVAQDRGFYEGRSDIWPEWKIKTRLESFLGYAGVGPFPGAFAASHKFGFDFETVCHVLEQAGFEEIVRSKYQGSEDPALRIDDTSTYAIAKVGERHYSLFVEARR